MGEFLLIVTLLGAWPILIEVVVVACMAIKKAAKSASAPRPAAPSTHNNYDPAPQVQNTEAPKQLTLSHENMVKACSAIIEDSYSYRDEFIDAIAEEGEGEFSVPDCVGYSNREYEAQFGSTEWSESWAEALTLHFGRRFVYKGKGVYIC